MTNTNKSGRAKEYNGVEEVRACAYRMTRQGFSPVGVYTLTDGSKVQVTCGPSKAWKTVYLYSFSVGSVGSHFWVF
jgi:hypothetical protein